ncbi:unnamed protein product [Rhizophagus irregularis]|uniref:Uncharacterized protein n=1 Tax=Rhizophagus irregularis TaxID=588596 RepID=A0A2I1G6D7_9GLOM|nr:hypothetical protein RhiirA4_455950 [Rhizophagus irregularis]CAB4418375.1 unnamed protein product [Rhizophagus irregularis]
MKVAVIGDEESEVQVLEQIEEAVRERQDQVVVKLQFPDGKLNSLNVRNAIHSYYKAEIINYELLIIQYDGGDKQRIHRKLTMSFKNQNGAWYTESDVFYNRDPDHQNALEKIDSLQNNLDGILNVEYVGIAIPHTYNTFRLNPFPGAPSMPAIATGQNRRPQIAPYLIHWDVTYTPHYYIINWNLHLRLRCGAIIDFNIILDVLSR